ncbi:MAG: GntR family transcriptional regulator [Eisenbergiella sp.]
MILEVDFNSDEALYIQLRDQIIVGIATNRLKEGDPLPSVRQLAESIGINMHTVNKAYNRASKQEGLCQGGQAQRGAVIAIDADRIQDRGAAAKSGDGHSCRGKLSGIFPAEVMLTLTRLHR